MSKYPEVVGIVAIVIVAAVVMFGMRWFNAAAVVVSVHHPEPGVTCAVATSADGVAIDCWQDRK